MFLTKEAVRLGLPGYADGVACDGCPPAHTPVPTIRRRRRGTPCLPDLLRRPQTRRGQPRGKRAFRRSNAPLGMDRR
jgi:hypothetical protein